MGQFPRIDSSNLLVGVVVGRRSSSRCVGTEEAPEQALRGLELGLGLRDDGLDLFQGLLVVGLVLVASLILAGTKMLDFFAAIFDFRQAQCGRGSFQIMA